MTIAKYDCKENEHQELFYLGIDPGAPVRIHIPSPLGRLPYHVFVRGPIDLLGRLDGVATKVDVGGLMDENLEIATGKVAQGVTWFDSKEQGRAWRLMCSAEVSRGNGALQFLNMPQDAGKLDLLLCTWPRFVSTGQADDWIGCQTDPYWAPSGVPLGGIGGGRVDICRDGRFRNFSMNNNQDAPLEDPLGVPGAYLAALEDENVCDLASRPVTDGHGAAPRLNYDARFPQARLSAPDIFDGVDIEAAFTGTLAPHDLKTSAIPGFLVRWTVTNHSDRERSIGVRLAWPNLIGIGGGVAVAETKIGEGDGSYFHFSDPSGRDQEMVMLPLVFVLRYSGTPAARYEAANGSHLLAVKAAGDQIAIDPDGSATATLRIAAGQSAQTTMAVVAAMPHFVDAKQIDRGAYWQNHFADGIEMAQYLLANADRIFEQTSALANHLADGSLPEWLVRRLSNCCYPLVTNSVLYKDGRFSINEGPTEMVGCYGTLDQRLAAHPATQLLFDDLNRQELSEFAAVQSPNGGMNHDLGHGHLEDGPIEAWWPDLICSFVIQTARHAWSTGDGAFDDAMYPRGLKALRRHAEWATAGRGVAQLGVDLGTSYDSYHYFATTGYMATLWIAALNVGEEWARRRGDDAILSQLAAWREAAVERLEADIWNGKYYDAYGNGAEISRKTCHAGQIAGQWFSQMLTGKDTLPAERLDQVVDSLIGLNGSDRYAVPPDEVAADGSVGSDFSWLPYIEGFMLTAIASRGDERLWPIWERMIKATYADGATPCDTRLMYIPETGAQTWGSYYMTAPASWLVYDAWLGFFYDAQTQLLRIRELTPGRYPIVAPLFWATLDVREDRTASLAVQRLFADSALPVANVERHGTDGVVTTALPPGSRIAEGAVIEWG